MKFVDWDKAATITDWLTAVGTIGATAAAVWLGLRGELVRLRLTAEAARSKTAKLYDFKQVWDEHFGNKVVPHATVSA